MTMTEAGEVERGLLGLLLPCLRSLRLLRGVDGAEENLAAAGEAGPTRPP